MRFSSNSTRALRVSLSAAAQRRRVRASTVHFSRQLAAAADAIISRRRSEPFSTTASRPVPGESVPSRNASVPARISASQSGVVSRAACDGGEDRRQVEEVVVDVDETDSDAERSRAGGTLPGEAEAFSAPRLQEAAGVSSALRRRRTTEATREKAAQAEAESQLEAEGARPGASSRRTERNARGSFSSSSSQQSQSERGLRLCCCEATFSLSQAHRREAKSAGTSASCFLPAVKNPPPPLRSPTQKPRPRRPSSSLHPPRGLLSQTDGNANALRQSSAPLPFLSPPHPRSPAQQRRRAKPGDKHGCPRKGQTAGEGAARSVPSRRCSAWTLRGKLFWTRKRGVRRRP